MLGTTPNVSEGPIFEQEQIARAVELGIGVSSFDEIEFLTDSPESEILVEKIRAEFTQ
jgi:diaminopimelate decarboxylase